MARVTWYSSFRRGMSARTIVERSEERQERVIVNVGLTRTREVGRQSTPAPKSTRLARAVS